MIPTCLISTFENAQTRTTPIDVPAPAHGRDDAVRLAADDPRDRRTSPTESEALLEELFSHLYRAECIYEHDWRHHDLVAWDNVSVQHARPNVTVEGPVRTLRKVFAPIPPRTAKPTRPKFATAG